jgi:hypothetical protein
MVDPRDYHNQTRLTRIMAGQFMRIAKALQWRKHSIAMRTGKRATGVKLATGWTIHQTRRRWNTVVGFDVYFELLWLSRLPVEWQSIYRLSG